MENEHARRQESFSVNGFIVPYFYIDLGETPDIPQQTTKQLSFVTGEIVKTIYAFYIQF
jgi:hypothetical protein